MNESPLPESVGPYRVLGKLGHGGMGEVLLAEDPRLGRRVAIKHLRAATEITSRRRFEREARLAASLSHPAIVPIFDWVEVGDNAYLVMELIEGPSLRRWLEQERPFEEKLKIAAQIAGGLVYAHGRGIVHRDLKSENILLTVRGEAKIADFGLAQQAAGAEPGAGAAGGDGSRLTREGLLVGTYRSLAPEQVWGERADARSDLFSFGVLLFELFGGISPFEAERPSETLRRLTGAPHPELGALAPELPAALVALVNRLLQKDRELRPQSAEEVAELLEELRRPRDEQQTWTAPLVGAGSPGRPRAAAASGAAASGAPTPAAAAGRRRKLAWAAGLAGLFLLLAALAFFGLPRPRSGPLYAAVLAPRLELQAPQQGEGAQRLAFAVRTAVLQQLSDLRGISPKGFEEVDQAALTEISAIAAAAGADELLRPAIFCSGPADCELRLERIRAGDGGLTGIEKSELSLEDLSLSSRSAAIATRRLYQDFTPRGRPGSAAIAAADFTLLLEIRREIAFRPDSRRLEARLLELRQLRQRSPDLLEASLLETEVAWRRFAETRQESFRENARAAMAAALAAAPADPEVLLRSAWLAILDGRPEEAEAALDAAEAAAPGDLRVVDHRALLLERSGQLEKSLLLRRQALAGRPSWFRYYNLAFACFQLNLWTEARANLDRLLAQAPQHVRALSLRARLELVAGDPATAVELYSALLALSDNLLDRANLANAYLLLGDGEAAGREALKVLAQAPQQPFFLLALADARGLAGRDAEAARLYAEVAQKLAGENDWQSLSVRAQAEARLGRKEAAITLLQEALQKAPEGDADMAFEAALVYSLLGERTPALVNIRKMVASGWGGWLRLAPFALWRDDPEIGPLLRAGIAGPSAALPREGGI